MRKPDHLSSASTSATSSDSLAVQTASILRRSHHDDERAPMLSDDNDLVPGLVAQNPNATRNSLALTLADEIVIKCEKKTARKFRGSTGSNNAMMISGQPSCRPA